MASKPNISNPNYAFNKDKQYTQVVFQQGKPILDVDLNDMSNALHAQNTSALAEKMGYGPSQIDFREWAMTAVDTKNPQDDRNKTNFAITLGRLDTYKGVIDLHELRAANVDSRVIFDYGLIVDNSETFSGDREYANYILKGSVTAGSSTTVIKDEHKNFQPDTVSEHHGLRLKGYTHDETIVPYSTINPITNPSESRSTKSAKVTLSESACRLRFINGNLNGQEQVISDVADGEITVNSAFSAIPNVGSQYVILPPNTLQEYRNLYNATTSQATSTHKGLSNLPQLITYVQVFEEDVSASEDSSIQSSALGVETTHRTQLRWCVRVAKLITTQEGDNDGTNDLTDLNIEHIYTFLESNRLVEHQALADATDDKATNQEGALQTQYWRESVGANIPTAAKILKRESPYLELGLTPAHFFNSEEYTLDRLYWSFLKALLLQSSGFSFNDFVVLNAFHSETKTNAAAAANDETLSEYFYPAAQTDTTVSPIVHAFLSVGNSFERAANDTNAQPARFMSPPRVFHTHADLSVDNMKSRTLHGLRGGILYGDNAPLVFNSPSAHFSFVDQMVLGMSGIGSALGETAEGYRIPSATDYTLDNSTASVAQAGYGVGAIKMLSPISASTISTGHADGTFLTGSSSYLLRDKGNRSSHTVNATDSDLGWSLYKQEDSNLTANTLSDFSIRGWDEGIAQAIAFQQGINFRKLAIKTTAHKSMDLFTISETPRQQANQHDQLVVNASSTAFQIPVDQSQTKNGSLFLDSYSGNVLNPSNFIPANVSRFDPKPLLQQYQATGGIKGFDQSSGADKKYGPWNRFDREAMGTHLPSALDDANAPTYSMDLWHNRCTAMRLRYHVGDFYPGTSDGRGVPRNELVDSLNLFVKVEPLSLAHWMTMPKHQHSILENSINFAEGIEALLKVSHGLGDTQKLVNSINGKALVQQDSPINNGEFPLYANPTVGSNDPTNLPFEHYKQPFVHWYHPAMHKIKSPHPDDNNNPYDANYTTDVTVYPKFGRRSLIIPALVPSKFGTHTTTNLNPDITVPITQNQQTGDAYPPLVGTDTATTVKGQLTVGIEDETQQFTVSKSILPYPYHGSEPDDYGNLFITTDDSTQITFKKNQITFPAVGTNGNEITPGPVFLPASRLYAEHTGTESKATVGFHPLLTNFTDTTWNDVNDLENTFPYDERFTHYYVEAGGINSVPANLGRDFDSWSVPVLKAAINTTTVAGIVKLVRTSFTTGLADTTLSADYSEFFTMPTNVVNNYTSGYDANQVPAIGPDNPVDTLFMGDLGTALGGFSNREGFISPLNFGVPMRINVGLMPNGMVDSTLNVRDSFDHAIFYMNFNPNITHSIIDTFNAIQEMGLQQKLMWNCSFRVLHTRPSGMESSVASTAPKSITEVFLAHDRTDGNMTKIEFPAPSSVHKKPFIHLMSMHPATSNTFPNKANMSHLYPMVSDSTGGPHGSTLINDGEYNYTDSQVKTASMGDTYAADPFDTMVNDTVFGTTHTPTRSTENLHKNSGIEIDLLNELNTIHASLGSYKLNLAANINATNISLNNTMPTANELTLPGDHELVFVLYTGHYGAKMFDTNDEVDVQYIPPVAGCHLTATLEINRPSERISSTNADQHHYGVQARDFSTNSMGPIKTYAIPSTKSSS